MEYPPLIQISHIPTVRSLFPSPYKNNHQSHLSHQLAPLLLLLLQLGFIHSIAHRSLCYSGFCFLNHSLIKTRLHYLVSVDYHSRMTRSLEAISIVLFSIPFLPQLFLCFGSTLSATIFFFTIYFKTQYLFSPHFIKNSIFFLLGV